MSQTPPVAQTVADPSAHALASQQVEFFESFGYLKLPGLFADEIGLITEGFEDVFADESNPRIETHERLHLERRRVIIPQVIDRSPKLSWIRDDPRTIGVVSSLVGDDFEFAESDGNLFDCESSWHADTYGSPLNLMHLKLSFYLDPLHGEGGAIRVIPGTSFHKSGFAKRLRRHFDEPEEIEEIYGVDMRDIPSVPIESDPGDLICWNFRTIHASFYGGQRRRLFSVNFREQLTEEQRVEGAKHSERQKRKAEEHIAEQDRAQREGRRT